MKLPRDMDAPEPIVEAFSAHASMQISHALYEVGGEYRRNM